jgi:caffeoyl-CoA O-methyltransferase
MANRTIGISDDLAAYVRNVGTREPDVLARLRDETAALPNSQMQVAPEEGAFLAMLAELTGTRRYLEIGTFTGYSSTAIALALPDDGRVVCCDISEEYTAVARRAWVEAGVDHKVTLEIGPAVETLDRLISEGHESSYDMAFIDADKSSYDDYYEGCLRLVRPGGLIAVDNVLWGGRVVDDEADDKDTLAIRALNDKIAADERVSMVLLPVADGVTLARVR